MSAYVVVMDGSAYGPFANDLTAEQWVKQMDDMGVGSKSLNIMPVVSPKTALKQAAGEEPPVQRQATVCLECLGVGKCKGMKKHHRVWMKDGKEFISKTLYDPYKRQKQEMAKTQPSPPVHGRIG